jgi:hypothetical protein
MEFLAANLIGILVMTVVAAACAMPFLWDFLKKKKK